MFHLCKYYIPVLILKLCKTLHWSFNNSFLMYLKRSLQSLVNNSRFHFAILSQCRRSTFNSVMALTSWSQNITRKQSKCSQGQTASHTESNSQVEELNNPRYIQNIKPGSEKIGHMLNCHSHTEWWIKKPV